MIPLFPHLLNFLNSLVPPGRERRTGRLIELALPDNTSPTTKRQHYVISTPQDPWTVWKYQQEWSS